MQSACIEDPKYAAKQDLSEEGTHKGGMVEKSKESTESGAEVYLPA